MGDQWNEENQNINCEETDMLLADFFFGCNVPFVIVESDHFRNFVKRLNPSYNLPTRKTLSTIILEKRYDIFKQSITKNASTNAVLLIDGWKNSSANTKNVVAMLRLSNGEHVFLDSWNFSSIRETGANLNEVVERSKEIATQQYNINIYAVITDNASNMMSMGRMTDLWHTTCNSHSGNLLCKALIDALFANKVNTLLKEFKSPYLENLLIEAGGNKIVLPGDTRWCSYRDSFRRCLMNVPLMRLIINNGAPIKEENREVLFDDTLEAMLQDHLVILDPLCELIRKCEKTTCNIADATEYWLKLEIPTINEEHQNLLINRVKKVINAYGLAANFLHPRYKGLRFQNNIEYTNTMNDFFHQRLSANGFLQLEDYKNGTNIFRTLFERNYTSWETFWKAAKYFSPELSSLANKLLNICSSTGELERFFSQWTYVHDPKRNRLKAHRSAKLVSLYYSLRLRDSIAHANLHDIFM